MRVKLFVAVASILSCLVGLMLGREWQPHKAISNSGRYRMEKFDNAIVLFDQQSGQIAVRPNSAPGKWILEDPFGKPARDPYAGIGTVVDESRTQ